MNILIAGIHGVGKSYLASRIAPLVGMVHTSASTLIREERSMATWMANKEVTDVEANQIALSNAIRRKNDEGISLLLDGHFVLLGKDHRLIRLEPEIFATFNLVGVILIQEKPETIVQRIMERDKREESVAFISEFAVVEKIQADIVCSAISIQLTDLISPMPNDVLNTINAMRSNKRQNQHTV